MLTLFLLALAAIIIWSLATWTFICLYMFAKICYANFIRAIGRIIRWHTQHLKGQ